MSNASSTGEAAQRLPQSYARGVMLVSIASMISPVIGLLTAPMLSRYLGVSGRGAYAAALAPGLMIIDVVHLGMPDAVAYFVAKHPYFYRRAVLLAELISLPLALGAIVIVTLTSKHLATDYPGLASLITLVTLSVIPLLFIGFLRGAAVGLQQWTMTALEKALNPILKLIGLVIIAATGDFSLRNALLVSVIGPVIAGLVYAPLLWSGPTVPDDHQHPTARMLLSFGARSWVGGLATMLMARLPEILIAPLSDFHQLGLYTVCLTVSAVPFVMTVTISQVVFGANSARRRDDELLATSSIGFVLASIVSLILGATLPWWIELVFGPGFGDAIVPTWISLLASSLLVPAMISGSAIAAAGRPGRRSIALLIALVGYVALLFIAVPGVGANGAALADLMGNIVVGGYCIWQCKLILGMDPLRFFMPRRQDLARVSTAVSRAVRTKLAARTSSKPE